MFKHVSPNSVYLGDLADLVQPMRCVQLVLLTGLVELELKLEA